MPTKRKAGMPPSPPPKKKVSSTTTKASVANFFKPASEKAAAAAALNKATWTEQMPQEGAKTSMLVARFMPEGGKEWSKTTDKVKIAAFDLDHTLIEPLSGKKFAKGVNDWRWWDKCVPEKLRSLHAEGFIITMFSNQAGLTLHPSAKAAAAIAKNPSKTDRVLEYKSKCNNFLHALDLPTTLFAATSKDVFRKPRTGMWDTLLKLHGLDAGDVDMAASFYVGDAAGRPARGARRTKDFSCSDRNLAANLGLTFFTPEEYFFGDERESFVRDFDPATVPREDTNGSVRVQWKKKTDREMVILCGPPASGKSSFWWCHCEPLGYVRINQDRLGSRDKCFVAAERAIEDGASVVIDNTNADTTIRGIWINLARENNMGVRCVHFKTPKEMCVHNDNYRSNSKGSPANPEDRDGLPDMAFSSFANRYQAPTLDEGFDEIFEPEFRFAGSDAEFAAWSKYWS